MSKSGLFAGLVGTAPADNADTEKQKGYHFMQWDTNVSTFIPPDSANLLLWLDAARPGSTPLQWDDKSGNGRHFTSPTGHFPDFINKTAIFEGEKNTTGTFLYGPDMTGFGDTEIFIKVKVQFADGILNQRGHLTRMSGGFGNTHYPAFNGTIISNYGANAQHLVTVGFPISDITSWRVFSSLASTTAFTLRLDDVVEAVGSGGTFTTGYQTIPVLGRSNTLADLNTGGGFEGEIKAVFIYNGELTGSDRTELMDYLLAL